MKANNKTSEKKLYNALIAACLTYYIVYMCIKNIYSAEIVEIMRDFGVTKTYAGISTTTAFVAYGIAQLILSRFIDRLNIAKLLYITVPLAMLSNFLIAFCTEIWQVWVLFGLGGGLAAGIYPSIITVIGKYLPDNMLLKANRIISFGFSLGFVTPYLEASLFIKLGSWRLAFWICPIVTAIFTPVFCSIVKKCDKLNKAETRTATKVDEPHSDSEFTRSKYLIFIILSGMLSLLSAFIYYGILGWITSLLNEVFGMTSSLSSLTSVLIPLAVYIGPLLQTRFCRRKSVWYVGIAFSAIMLLFPIALAAFYKLNIVLTLLLTIGMLILDRGVNNLAALEIPLRYRESVNTGMLATVLNVFGCVGAAAGAPVMGNIIDNYGHSTNYWFSAAMIVLMIAFIVPGEIIFSKKRNQKMLIKQ